MALASREIAAPRHVVFEHLLDPRTYPEWLAGAADIREVDEAWPEPGSRFHHRVGVGPLKLADSTTLLEVQPDRLLRLAVRARPAVSAIATFRVVGEGDRCVVTFQEEPNLRVIGNLVRPVLDPLTHLRNHRSLERLADLVEAEQEARPGLSGRGGPDWRGS
jgi:uncharacterized protein YndB with AHSA1/START domain